MVDFVDLFPSLVLLDHISPFNICCKAGLVVLNSLNSCLSEKLFIFPSILNEILAGYSNLGCRFVPFNTLNISCHSLLAWRVSTKRPAVILMGIPCVLFVVFPLLLLIFILCVWSLLIWLICVLGCFALGLSCLGLSELLGLGWLFPSPF